MPYSYKIALEYEEDATETATTSQKARVCSLRDHSAPRGVSSQAIAAARAYCQRQKPAFPKTSPTKNDKSFDFSVEIYYAPRTPLA